MKRSWIAAAAMAFGWLVLVACSEDPPNAREPTGQWSQDDTSNHQSQLAREAAANSNGRRSRTDQLGLRP
jgi:hypothetical protein